MLKAACLLCMDIMSRAPTKGWLGRPNPTTLSASAIDYRIGHLTSRVSLGVQPTLLWLCESHSNCFGFLNASSTRLQLDLLLYMGNKIGISPKYVRPLILSICAIPFRISSCCFKMRNSPYTTKTKHPPANLTPQTTHPSQSH